MSDFVQFWSNCFIDGVSAGKGALLFTELLSLFLWVYFGRDEEHKTYKNWEKKIKSAAKWLFILLFPLFTIFIAPYKRYCVEKKQSDLAQKLLNDKSPNLEGFIHRIMIADEPGTTNSFILADVSLSNLGSAPSIAEEYGVGVIVSPNRPEKAKEINFADDFKLNFIHNNEPWMVDLKRHQLITEKTIKAIPSGQSYRGWLAYRLYGIQQSQYQSTNVFFTFLDINGKRSYATNGLWRGKTVEETNFDDLTMVIPGAENIFYPNPPEKTTNWLPPELPPGCSNVLVFFGANGMNYSRTMAEISSEGTKFAIKDLPDFYLQNLDKVPGYSPRQKYLWIKDSMAFSIGGKTVPYPVQPVIISNRLYVEVEIPFLNEKRKIIMSDDFDPELPIPPHWDRNYSTNYYANGIVSGGIYAYEVVNELTNPVLQVGYTAPNEVHVTGIFKVDENSILATFGQQPMLLTLTNRVVTGLESTQRITTISLEGTNFSEIFKIYTNDSMSSIGEMITNEFYRPIFPGQRTLFKYPSNRNLGVFNDETNALH